MESNYLYSTKFLSQEAVKTFVNVLNLQRCHTPSSPTTLGSAHSQTRCITAFDMLHKICHFYEISIYIVKYILKTSCAETKTCLCNTYIVCIMSYMSATSYDSKNSRTANPKPLNHAFNIQQTVNPSNPACVGPDLESFQIFVNSYGGARHVLS